LESIPGLQKGLKIPSQDTQPGGIGFLESTLGLLKSVKIQALTENRIQTSLRNLKMGDRSTGVADSLQARQKNIQKNSTKRPVKYTFIFYQEIMFLEYLPVQFFVFMTAVVWNFGR
jgi:hypothetical protein